MEPTYAFKAPHLTPVCLCVCYFLYDDKAWRVIERIEDTWTLYDKPPSKSLTMAQRDMQEGREPPRLALARPPPLLA